MKSILTKITQTCRDVIINTFNTYDEAYVSLHRMHTYVRHIGRDRFFIYGKPIVRMIFQEDIGSPDYYAIWMIPDDMNESMIHAENWTW